MKYLSAYTALTPAPYPPFVSFSETDDGGLEIVMHGDPAGDRSGPMARVTIPREKVAGVLQGLLNITAQPRA